MRKKIRKIYHTHHKRKTVIYLMKHKHFPTLLALTGLSCLLFILMSSISANVPQPVFADSNSINFENPPYVTGVIDGQDGWTSKGAAGAGCALYDQAVSPQSIYPTFGSQSLRISDAVTSGCFGDQVFAKPLNDSVGETISTAGTFSPGTKQRHFEMQFDIASATPNDEQPGLHVSVSPDRGDGSRMSYLRFEDSSNGINVFFDDVEGILNPANFVETQIGTGLDRTVPHRVKLTFDAIDGPSNDVVKVWIDDNLVITGTSWENYYRYDSEAASEPTPRIVKTVIFRSAGSANPANAGKGFYFDNLSLNSGPILVSPTGKDQCKDSGWKIFNNPTFKNQGQCVDFVEHINKTQTGSVHNTSISHNRHRD